MAVGPFTDRSFLTYLQFYEIPHLGCQRFIKPMFKIMAIPRFREVRECRVHCGIRPGRAEQTAARLARTRLAGA